MSEIICPVCSEPSDLDDETVLKVSKYLKFKK